MFDFLLDGIGYEVVALTLLRYGTGMFFAISGYHKLFNKGRRESLRSTFEADGIPFIPLNMYLVPITEFIGGSLLAFGLFTVPCAIALQILLAVALLVDGVKTVEGYNPLDFADRVDDYLYLPETIYLLVMCLFVTAGPGQFSLDYLLFG